MSGTLDLSFLGLNAFEELFQLLAATKKIRVDHYADAANTLSHHYDKASFHLAVGRRYSDRHQEQIYTLPLYKLKLDQHNASNQYTQWERRKEAEGLMSTLAGLAHTELGKMKHPDQKRVQALMEQFKMLMKG